MTSKFFILSISVFLLFQCKPKSDYADLLKNVKVNPAFEMAPPIAENIFIKALSKPDDLGNNIQLIAEFGKGTLESEFHALMVGDEKVVLRDDGKFGDEVKGDGIFTLNLKENLDEISTELENRQKLILSEQELVTFNNRSLQQINTEELRSFNLKGLVQDRNLRIPIEFFKNRKRLSDHTKTLMINNTAVVEDTLRTFNPCTQVGNPTGPWTFGELMRQMASDDPSTLTDAEVSNFVRDWLNTWRSDTIVNGDPLLLRNNINSLILNWETKSGIAPGGILKMQFAPFKLIAIVNRLDLRGNSGYGFSNAGEGRMVFNAINSTCNPLPFTVIFEYGIHKRTCTEIKAFANEWNDLDSLTIGTPAYNAALENITNQFTLANTGGSDSLTVNGSSLNQLRTNEIALGSPWEMREFILVPPGKLDLTTVKQEPAAKYNVKINTIDVERLVTFINSNATNIENNNYTVPNEIPTGGTPATTPFLAGKSLVPTTSLHWNGTDISNPPTFITSDTARHIFSLNTCSGCHAGETSTFFTHINPASFGSPATLSGFLTGITVIDPANRPTGAPASRTFNDLLRRRNDLAQLVSINCFKVRPSILEIASRLTFRPVRMVH
jgi:hypothetical protein